VFTVRYELGLRIRQSFVLKGLRLDIEIITVCSEIPTEHITTARGENVELLDVKPGYRSHWAFTRLCNTALNLKGPLKKPRNTFAKAVTHQHCAGWRLILVKWGGGLVVGGWDRGVSIQWWC
jgi:hypothetical protein